MLAFKILLTPALIGLVSLAGRRWGPAISGWFVGLPLTSAPITLFLALDQGTAFAARSAQGTLLGMISYGSFCLAYCWLSLRFEWSVSLLGGWGAFLLSTFLLERFLPPLPLIMAFVMVIVFLALVVKFSPVTEGASKTVQPPRWEMPLRMVTATAFVLALTAASSLLGPQLSGLFTPFPIYAAILGAFTHRFESADAARRLLRSSVIGSFTFAVFFLVVSATIAREGIALAFSAAVLVAMLVHGSSLWFLRRGAKAMQ